jgi:hypothetical protein
MGSVCVREADPSTTEYAAYVFSGASFHQLARLIRE